MLALGGGVCVVLPCGITFLDLRKKEEDIRGLKVSRYRGIFTVVLLVCGSVGHELSGVPSELLSTRHGLLG